MKVKGDLEQWNTKKWIVGKEVGESGTPHLQGYAMFANPVRFSHLKSSWPRAHLERAKGNAKQNYVYCSKDGDFESHGFTPSETELEKEDLAADHLLECHGDGIYNRYHNALWRHEIMQDAFDMCSLTHEEELAWRKDERTICMLYRCPVCRAIHDNMIDEGLE